MLTPYFDSFDPSAFQMKFCTSAPFGAAINVDVLARWPGGLTEYFGMAKGGGGTVLSPARRPTRWTRSASPGPTSR